MQLEASSRAWRFLALRFLATVDGRAATCRRRSVGFGALLRLRESILSTSNIRVRRGTVLGGSMD
jgi:hypothetical protein